MQIAPNSPKLSAYYNADSTADNTKKLQAVVTGANSGIGFAVTKRLINSGYTVLALDMRDNNLQVKLDEIEKSNVKFIKIDLSDQEETNKKIPFKEGADLIVNSAGIREICPFKDLSLSEWNKVQAINITAPFIISQGYAKESINAQRPLNIINISSISGFFAEPNRSAYIASKHALIGLTKGMAFELGKNNIRVNAIAPGVTRTEMTESYFKDDKMTSLINKNTPLGRAGNVDNIVHAVEYLEKNNYVTGEVMVVDGGWSIGKDL